MKPKTPKEIQDAIDAMSATDENVLGGIGPSDPEALQRYKQERIDLRVKRAAQDQSKGSTD